MERSYRTCQNSFNGALQLFHHFLPRLSLSMASSGKSLGWDGQPISRSTSPPPTRRGGSRKGVKLAESSDGQLKLVDAAPPLEILVASWNCGNRAPDPSELKHWLPAQGGKYDIIIVGTQENRWRHKQCANKEESMAWGETGEDGDSEEEEEPQRPSAVSRDSISESSFFSALGSEISALRRSQQSSDNGGRASLRRDNRHPWERMCLERLGDRWQVCAHTTLREMRLTVYTRREVARRVRHVATASAATGIGGVIGNKGGLVARLCIDQQTTLGICSCHLAAHEGAHHLLARNRMCQEILIKTMGKRVGHGRQLDVAHSTDHLIWLGDLNYRIDTRRLEPPVTPAKGSKTEQVQRVCDLCNAGRFDELLAADELGHARACGDAFVGFVEGPMTSWPTFKVLRQPGTAYTEQRTPSYTDRCLWKSLPPHRERLTQTTCESIPQVSTSDHKPLVCSFTLAATPPLHRTPNVQSIIRVSALTVRDILCADFTGTSDPFVVFMTQPEGLLRHSKRGVSRQGFTRTTEAPRSTIKYRVKPGAEAGAVGDARLTHAVNRRSSSLPRSSSIDSTGPTSPSVPHSPIVAPSPSVAPSPDRTGPPESKPAAARSALSHVAKLCCPTSKSQPNALLASTHDSALESVAVWADSDVPALQVCAPVDVISRACLLIAIFDYDRWKANDPLGVVTVPLARAVPAPADSDDARLERAALGTPRALQSGYQLDVDEPIVLGHSTTGTGRLSCTLHVDEHVDQSSRWDSSSRGASEASLSIARVRRPAATSPSRSASGGFGSEVKVRV